MQILILVTGSHNLELAYGKDGKMLKNDVIKICSFS